MDYGPQKNLGGKCRRVRYRGADRRATVKGTEKKLVILASNEVYEKIVQ